MAAKKKPLYFMRAIGPGKKKEKQLLARPRLEIFWRLEKWHPKNPEAGTPAGWDFIGLYTTEKYARTVARAYHGRTRVVRQEGLNS